VREGEQGGSSAVNVITGTLAASVYLGELAERQLTVGDARLSMYELNPPLGGQATTGQAGGERVRVVVASDDVQLLPIEEPPP
jgi:hypothetical protein